MHHHLTEMPTHLRNAVLCLSLAIVWTGLGIDSATAAEPPVTAVAFAPDGRSVVIGSQAGLSVRRWPGLEPLRTLPTGLVSIHDLAFSPNGQLLAAAGGTPSEEGLVEILAWPGGELRHRCGEHLDIVLAVTWKNDGEFATGSLDREILVWDAAEFRVKHRMRGHSDGVTDLIYLPTGDRLVSSGLDQNLITWEPEAEKIFGTLNNHKNAVHQIALRPAGEGLPMIASVGEDRTVRLWQPTLGRLVRFLELQTVPLAVGWLPEGDRLVVGCTDGIVRLIDPETVEVVQEIPALENWIYSLAVHPQGDGLLVGGPGGQLKRIGPDVLTPSPQVSDSKP